MFCGERTSGKLPLMPTSALLIYVPIKRNAAICSASLMRCLISCSNNWLFPTVVNFENLPQTASRFRQAFHSLKLSSHALYLLCMIHIPTHPQIHPEVRRHIEIFSQ